MFSKTEDILWYCLGGLIVIVSILLIIAMIIGSDADKIRDDKVDTVSYPLVNSNVDTDSMFTLIPIVTSDGKNTTTTLIPQYQQYDHITVWYRKGKHVVKLTTDDFDVVKTSGKSMVKLKVDDIGKSKAPCVVYLKDS